MNLIVARFRKCSDLVPEGKVFVENKTKVASGVGCSERAVLYFTELLFKSNKKKFTFRRVEKIGSHPRRDRLIILLIHTLHRRGCRACVTVTDLLR